MPFERGKWYVLQKHEPDGNMSYQLAMRRDNDFAKIGPWSRDLDEVRAMVAEMLEAFDRPIVTPLEAGP